MMVNKEAIEIINDNNITYNYIQEHDLGCIHHHMENNHSALWHFSLAQKQHRNITKPNGSPVVMIPKIKREISSSSAYQLLLAGKYVPAFQLFVNELSCEKDSARLWLRTAECVAYHHGTTVAQTRMKQYSSCINRCAQLDSSTKIISLSTTNNSYIRKDPRARDDHSAKSEDNADIQLNLNFASKCIRNAIYISEQNYNAGVKQTINRSILESSLILSGYIHLCCDNPIIALSHCNKLLDISTHDSHKILASIYAAEALCQLNKTEEAAKMIDPRIHRFVERIEVFNIDNNNKYSRIDSSYITHVNMSVLFILKGDISEAKSMLRKAMDIKMGASVVIIQAYISLREGDTQYAIELLSKAVFE